MISYIEGTLAMKHPTGAVVEVGGVGLLCLISLTTYAELPEEGDPGHPVPDRRGEGLGHAQPGQEDGDGVDPQQDPGPPRHGGGRFKCEIHTPELPLVFQIQEQCQHPET